MSSKPLQAIQIEWSDDMQTIAHNLASDTEGFNQLAILLTHLAGVNLPNVEKNYSLMANRICPILISHGLKNYSDYLQLIGQGNPEIVSEFISVMTTHTTQFFRESVQIDFFKQIMPPYFQQQKQKHKLKFRLWCAATSIDHSICSTQLIR